MADVDPGLASRPDHVPPELVFDFDLFDIPGSQEDIQLAMRAYQQSCPDIFWTPRNGGHWVVTRAEDIARMHQDWRHFSNDSYLIPKKPPELPKELPLECDPPRHTALRKPLSAALMPKVIYALDDKIRALAVELVEAVRPLGTCEFVDQIGQALPISIFLDLAGLPRSDRHFLQAIAHETVHSPTQEQRFAGYAKLYDYLGAVVRERRAHPGDDLISKLVNVNDGSERISEADAFSYASLVLLGGLDTVASLLGLVIRFLARNPDIRREIIAHLDDEEFMRTASEELMRRHGVAVTARLVVEDIELKGVTLKGEDMICVLHPLSGLDERFIADPLTLDLRRPPVNTHTIFSGGPHVCPGSVLARRELKIFLQEWLRRIPDFDLAPGVEPTTTTAPVCCLHNLHLVWPVRKAN
jgi:cytochrome P450